MFQRLFTCLPILLLICSCTSYQYVHLASDLPKTRDTGHYYLADSSVYVDFDFNGNHLPIRIFVLNEDTVPIYLDMTETMFFEDSALLVSAHAMGNGELETDILVPRGMSAAFEFRPYSSELSPLVKAAAHHVEVSDSTGKEHATGVGMGSLGRTFDVLLTYRKGDYDGVKKTVTASFKEEFVYFTNKAPQFFPKGTAPHCYYVVDENEAGRIAAQLLIEAAMTTALIMLETAD